MRVRLSASLFLASLLSLALFASVLAQATPEKSVSASFSVNEVISLTIVDNGAAGLQFGSVLPGSVANPDLGMVVNSTPSVSLAIGAETNVPCDVRMRGTNFSSSAGSVAISNMYWSTSGSWISNNRLSTTDQTIANSVTSASEPTRVWHWLSLPNDVNPGTYTGTVIYSAVKSGQ